MSTIRRYSTIYGKIFEAASPPVIENRAPTTSDRNFNLLQTWLNPDTQQIYALVGKTDTGLATWILIQTGGASTDVQTIEGVDGGGPISPNASGTIFFDGSQTQVQVTGSGNTITLSVPAVYEVTSDSGNATPTAAGLLTIAGSGAVTTSASGNTLTVNGASTSLPYQDLGTPGTLSVDNGYFITATGTYTLPASPAVGDTVEIISEVGASVAVTANAGQTIQIANDVSGVAGSATSQDIGDSLILKFRATSSRWYAIASSGNWIVSP